MAWRRLYLVVGPTHHQHRPCLNCWASCHGTPDVPDYHNVSECYRANTDAAH